MKENIFDLSEHIAQVDTCTHVDGCRMIDGRMTCDFGCSCLPKTGIIDPILIKVIAFLDKRAETLYNLGGVHIRESVSLSEAARMIEQGIWE